MHLARELGYASPRRMLDEMSVAELYDWLAYFHRFKFSEARADERMEVFRVRLLLLKADNPSELESELPSADHPYEPPAAGMLEELEKIVHQEQRQAAANQ